MIKLSKNRISDYRNPKHLKDHTARPYTPQPSDSLRSPYMPLPRPSMGEDVRRDIDKALLAVYKRRG